jgi:ATP synthase protein I
MQVTDARILRGAAIPTGLVGLVAIALSTAVAGLEGLVGSTFGVALAAVFFASSLIAVGRVARSNPIMMMNVAMLTYLVKILALGILLVLLRDTTAFDTKAFAWSILVCALVWTAAEVRVLARLKILYVEPDEAPARPAGPSS